MGFIKSLRNNLAASAAGTYTGSKSCFELDSNGKLSPATPPRSDRSSHHSSMSQFSLVDDTVEDDAVPSSSSSSILRASSRRSIDYASSPGPGGSSRGRALKPSSHGGPSNGTSRRASLDEQRPGPARRASLEEQRPGPARRASLEEQRPGPIRRSSLEEQRPGPARRASLDEQRPAPARRTSLDESLPGQSLRGELRGSGQQSVSFKVASKSDWYGPASHTTTTTTPLLPSLGNDHATTPSWTAAPRSHDKQMCNEGGGSSRGSRHIRFGDEAPAETSVRHGNSRKSLDLSRAENTWTGEERISSRKSIDLGNFSRNSIDNVRNDINERASQSMNFGSPKPALAHSPHDNTSSRTSNRPSSGRDPRQRAARFEETMEKLFHIEGDYYKEEVGKMMRKEEEEQKHMEAEKEAERFAMAQKELKENDAKRQEELWEKLRREKAKLSIGGIAKLVMKVKGLKANAHDLVEKTHDGAVMDLAAVDAAKSAIETERKVEAVFSSFSQYGKWDPQHMVLPQHSVKGMGGLKFLSVCRRAGLVDDDCITPRLIRDLFSVHKDTATSLLSFHNFVVALTELSELNNWKEEAILQAVVDINAEGIMIIHAEDYDAAS